VRLGLDVRSVRSLREGIGNYTLYLAKGYAAAPGAVELVLFGRADTAWNLLPDCERRVGPAGPRWHVWAARQARTVDVFHSPGSLFVPLLAGRRCVLTVHDLVPFRMREAADPWSTVTHRVFKAAVRRAAAIVTPSRHAAADLADFLPDVADKTTTVPLTSRFPASADAGTAAAMADADMAAAMADAGTAAAMADAETPTATDLAPGYILSVGSLEPRKNLAALLDAHARLPDAPPLVLVGHAGWRDSALAALIARHPRPIRLLRDVDDVALRALYARCGVFVFPSLYEGFGLPVVEAMACGAPVVASDATAVPEAAGSAAVLFDPRDPAALAGAIDRVLKDTALRSDLISRGRSRALKRNWEDVARETLDVCRQVAALAHSAGDA